MSYLFARVFYFQYFHLLLTLKVYALTYDSYTLFVQYISRSHNLTDKSRRVFHHFQILPLLPKLGSQKKSPELNEKTVKNLS